MDWAWNCLATVIAARCAIAFQAMTAAGLLGVAARAAPVAVLVNVSVISNR